MTSRYSRQSAQRAALVRQMLGEMADRCETRRPDAILTPVGRIAMIQATTMSPPLARELRTRAPEITAPITRRAYAEKLRQAAAAVDAGLTRTRAERIATLHDECDQDYADGKAARESFARRHRDDRTP